MANAAVPPSRRLETKLKEYEDRILRLEHMRDEIGEGDTTIIEGGVPTELCGESILLSQGQFTADVPIGGARYPLYFEEPQWTCEDSTLTSKLVEDDPDTGLIAGSGDGLYRVLEIGTPGTYHFTAWAAASYASPLTTYADTPFADLRIVTRDGDAGTWTAFPWETAIGHLLPVSSSVGSTTWQVSCDKLLTVGMQVTIAVFAFRKAQFVGLSSLSAFLADCTCVRAPIIEPGGGGGGEL